MFKQHVHVSSYWENNQASASSSRRCCLSHRLDGTSRSIFFSGVDARECSAFAACGGPSQPHKHAHSAVSQRRGGPVTPGVAGRSATRHVALCSPRGCTNVVFHRCSAYPSARCVLIRGQHLVRFASVVHRLCPARPRQRAGGRPAVAAVIAVPAPRRSADRV